jgi:hypothetical protein
LHGTRPDLSQSKKKNDQDQPSRNGGFLHNSRRPALQPIGLLNHCSVFEEDFTVKQVEWREALHFGITLMAPKNFSHVKVELSD